MYVFEPSLGGCFTGKSLQIDKNGQENNLSC